MKKATLLLALATAALTACTGNKTTATNATEADTTQTNATAESTELQIGIQSDVPPIPFYMIDGENAQVAYWTEMELWEEADEALRTSWAVQNAVHQHPERYTKILGSDNTLYDATFKEEILGDSLHPADVGMLRNKWHKMQGLKYDVKDLKRLNRNGYRSLAWLLADDYLADRKMLNVKHGAELGGSNPLPADIIQKMEAKYKGKADRSEITAHIGDKYTAGFIQFKPQGETCLAVEVVTDGEHIWSYSESAEFYDGEFSWHVDDGGEYFGNSVDAAFEGPNGLELLFTHYAPESVGCGWLTTQGKTLLRNYEIAGYYNYPESDDARDE